MMLKSMVLFASMAVAACDVSHLFGPGHRSPVYQGSDQSGGILKQESDIHPDGSYSWAYETENGISANEQGTETRLALDQTSKTAQGGFQYTSPEGQVVQISYVADENGFQPIGDAIPTPHPIPAAIQRAIQYIEANQGKEYPDINVRRGFIQ